MRDVSLHLLDIIQNSVAAVATWVSVEINIDCDQDELRIRITDNGKGMDEEMLRHVTDPFSTTRQTRKVGLGLPLFKATAERAAGKLAVSSVLSKGTIVEAVLKISHMDRPPLGDIADTMMNVILAGPDILWELHLGNGKECFDFYTSEVKARLGDVPITQYDVLVWIKEYIDQSIKSIFGGVLDEIIS